MKKIKEILARNLSYSWRFIATIAKFMSEISLTPTTPIRPIRINYLNFLYLFFLKPSGLHITFKFSTITT